MKLNFLGLIASVAVLTVTLACTPTTDGRKKFTVLPGGDTITGRYERSVEQIFAAAKEVLKFNGTLYGENTISHTLEAKIDTRTVWVSVEEVEPKLTQIKVKSRKKNTLPDIQLSAEIEKQIALRLMASGK